MIGLITFPVLTRTLSVEDYGYIGLVAATVTVFVSLAKLGLQTALLRFYAAARVQGQAAVRDLLGNLTGLISLLLVLGLLFWLAYSWWLVPLLQPDSRLRYLFLLASLLVPIKIIHSMLNNLLQAEQRSALHGTLNVAQKFTYLICLLLVLWLFGLSADRVLLTMVTVEGALLMVLAWCCLDYFRGVRGQLHRPTLEPMIRYGFPAMLGELTLVLLQTGDRYAIASLMDAAALGHYAAVANICMYLEWVLILSLQSAMLPHYLKLYEEKGRERTLAFLEGALRWYAVIAIGVCVVFIVAAPNLVLLLAGERFRPGLVVIPWFAAGYVLVGGIGIAAAGVFIDKRTHLLVKWTLIAFIINMLLNILAIPYFGLLAAAVATFVAMLIRAVGVYRDAATSLPVPMPWRAALIGCVSALPAWWLAMQVQTGQVLIDLFLCSAVATVTYALLILALDQPSRQVCQQQASRLVARLR